jgi:sensor domain CHASE-containing protein
VSQQMRLVAKRFRMYYVTWITPLKMKERIFGLSYADSWTKSRGAVSRRQSESNLLANVHLRQGGNGEVNNLFFLVNFKEPLLVAYET